MPKPRTETGEKNLVGPRLKALRERDGLSQRDLAQQLQLIGVDMDKNVLLVKGSVPGPKGAILKIKATVKSAK